MGKQQFSDRNWESMLKQWSLDQGSHRLVPLVGSIYNNHPANLLNGGTNHRPAPKWRGRIQKYFMTHPPPPGYDIADRVYDISYSFPLPYKSSSEDESSESEDESGEDECDVEVKKKKKKKEFEVEVESGIEIEVKIKDESEDVIIEDEVKKKEELLDELQAYVESVDVASVLHSDKRLFPFLHHVLPHKHAGIRAKGAEVVTTMVQNNPTSQQLVIKEKGLKLLLQNFTSDPDATSRTKALAAISSLIWNNNSGITEFRRESGYAALKNALISGSVCQREVLNLILYLLHENNSDCNIVTELGLPHIMLHLKDLLVLTRDDKLKQALQELISAMTPRDDVASKLFEPPLKAADAADRNSVSEKTDCNIVTELGLPRIMIHLASSDDAEVREAALRGLLALARDEGGNSGQLIKNDDKLKQVLKERIERISAMAPEDLGAAREERQLVNSLWNACYNEPSSLKLFEPSLGACAADSNSVQCKSRLKKRKLR